MKKEANDNNADIVLKILQNSVWIKLSATRTGGGRIYEMQPSI